MNSQLGNNTTEFASDTICIALLLTLISHSLLSQNWNLNHRPPIHLNNPFVPSKRLSQADIRINPIESNRPKIFLLSFNAY